MGVQGYNRLDNSFRPVRDINRIPLLRLPESPLRVHENRRILFEPPPRPVPLRRLPAVHVEFIAIEERDPLIQIINSISFPQLNTPEHNSLPER